MKSGINYKSGDVVLAYVPFVDSNSFKQRPALVLFNELGNIVLAGITSNLKMKGVSLTKQEGMLVNSVIKLNYIFTCNDDLIKGKLTELSTSKKSEVHKEFLKLIDNFKFPTYRRQSS